MATETSQIALAGELLRLIAENAILVKELKRRSMIFQYDAKVVVFEKFGLTHPAIQDISYIEWVILRNRYREDMGFDP